MTLGDYTPDSPNRKIIAYWRPADTSDANLAGYFWEVKRCTSVTAATDTMKCATGYKFHKVTDTDNFINRTAADCDVDCGSLKCCQQEIDVERGWYIRFRVWPAEGSGAVNQPAVATDDNYLQITVLQSKTGPDRITGFTSYTTANDGRHRLFSWNVPRDNGHAITKYRLRRTYSGSKAGIPATYDYIFGCDSSTESSTDYDYDDSVGKAQQLCSASTGSCWAESHGYYCVGRWYTDPTATPYPKNLYDVTWDTRDNRAVKVAVGCDEGCMANEYLHPAEQYTWQVIAHTVVNEDCQADSSCEDTNEGRGWSTSITETQQDATPDSVSNQQVIAQTQTSLSFNWTSPESNGQAVTSFQIICRDHLGHSDYSSDTYQYAHSTWASTTKTFSPTIADAGCSSEGATCEYTGTGLITGTDYYCEIGAINSVGGWGSTIIQPLTVSMSMTWTNWDYRYNEEVFNEFFAQTNTDPDYPSAISGPECHPILDPVAMPGEDSIGDNSAPSFASPTEDNAGLWFMITWTGNRPNYAGQDNDRNKFGCDQFYVFSSTGASTITTTVDGIANNFERDFFPVKDADGHSKYCGVNRYNYALTKWWYPDTTNPSTSNEEKRCSGSADSGCQGPYFSTLDDVVPHASINEKTCLTQCVGSNQCTGISLKSCTNGQYSRYPTESGNACSECTQHKSQRTFGCPAVGACSDGSTSLTWYTSAGASSGGTTGQERCYQRRYDRRHQAVLLTTRDGTNNFEYNTEYKFRINARNSNAGDYSNAPTSPEVTCMATAYRPARVHSVVATSILDRKIFIQWGEPDTYGGGSIVEYIYQICRTNSITATSCSDGYEKPQWTSDDTINRDASQTRYMCNNAAGGSKTACGAQATSAGDTFQITGISETETYDGDASPLNPRNLYPGELYMIIIRAKTGGFGFGSQPIVVETSDAPASPTKSSATTSTMTVAWTAYQASGRWHNHADSMTRTLNASPTKYMVRLWRESGWHGTSCEGASECTHETTGISTLTHTFPGLVAGYTYYVDVKAYMTGGYWSGWSTQTGSGSSAAPRKIVTAADVPGQPPVAEFISGSARSRSLTFKIRNPELDHNSQIRWFKVKMTDVDSGTVTTTQVTSSHALSSYGNYGPTCGTVARQSSGDGIQTVRNRYKYWWANVRMPNLKPNKRYTIKYVANNVVGDSAESPVLSGGTIKTCGEEPDDPDLDTSTGVPSLKERTETSITIQWNQPDLDDDDLHNGGSITKFEVRMWRQDRDESTATDPANTHVITCGSNPCSASDRELMLSNVQPGYQYKFKIRVYNGQTRTNGGDSTIGGLCNTGGANGWSSWSDWSQQLSPITTPPHQPGPVVAVDRTIGGKSMDVTWTAPFANGDPITAFTLYTSATWCGYLIVDVVSVPARVVICGWASGEPKAVSTVMGENTTVVLQSLSPVTSYTFRVSANNSQGESVESVLTQYMTDFYEPERIFASAFTNPPVRTDNSILIEWTAPQDHGLVIKYYELNFRFKRPCMGTCVNNEGTAYPDQAAVSPTGDGATLDNRICKAAGGINIDRTGCAQGNYYADSSPPCATAATECVDNSYTHDRLLSATEYQYKVRAFNSYDPAIQLDTYNSILLDGWSPWSDWIDFVTTSSVPLVPPKPAMPSERTVESRAASFRWSVPSATDLGQTPEVNRYLVEIIDEATLDADGSAMTLNVFEGFTSGEDFDFFTRWLTPMPFANYNNYSVADGLLPLLPYTNYSIRLKAGNQEGESIEWSDRVWFRTLPDKPDQITAIDTLSFTNVSITFNWTLPRDNGAALDDHLYELCQTQPSEVCSYAPSGSGPTNTVTIETGASGPSSLVVPGTVLKFRVRAENAEGNGDWSSYIWTETAARPDQMGVVVEGAGIPGLSTATSIQFTWTTPDFHRAPLSATELELTDPDGGVNVLSLDGYATEYILHPVVPGSDYIARVRVYNEYEGGKREAYLTTLHAGAFFGEIALLTADHKRTASVKAATFCELQVCSCGKVGG